MYKFNAKEVTENLVAWIADWFAVNAPNGKAFIGVSGGKDSSIVTALCVKALGRDRVVGVLMPDGVQVDIEDSKDLISFLGIESHVINIGEANRSIYHELLCSTIKISERTSINMPARMRVVALYAISQSCNGMVIGTANLSESYIGWNTRWDLSNCNDLNPIAGLTVTEVKAIGRKLGLPDRFIEKVPSDGLCGSTDEEKLGFKYDDLDNYLRTGVCKNANVKKMIDDRHRNNLFKYSFANVFDPGYEICAGE